MRAEDECVCVTALLHFFFNIINKQFHFRLTFYDKFLSNPIFVNLLAENNVFSVHGKSIVGNTNLVLA